MDRIVGSVGQLYTIDGLFGLSIKPYHLQLHATPLDDMFTQNIILWRMFTFVFKKNSVYIILDDDTVLVSDLAVPTDTGAFKTYLPTSVVNNLFPDVWKQMHLGNYVVRCDARSRMPTLLVSLEDHRLKWEPNQYIEQLAVERCQSVFEGVDLYSAYGAIVGLSFLRHFSVVFDVDEE
ncbi:hypothetical protein X801_10709 [Opisthorchis viverrini]|uniref:Peptidase A1 domain-containing protein n=1 Tax=Opisthorchis viverrini TaxID=6198 RepID=A0A1S8WGD3_OPIVI|nr:hypothetical protein X801_10709 [Opisthorchis viverrini]